MAQAAKLWGSGSAVTDDITKTNCNVLSSYPTILTPSEGHLIKSATVAPAAWTTVTLTAMATDSTHITFQSGGANLLGTKVLEYWIYADRSSWPNSGNSLPKIIFYACGASATGSALVSSANPVKLSATNTGVYLAWRNNVNSAGSCYFRFSDYASTRDWLNLSYTGADGDLTVTLQYDTNGNSAEGVFDTDYTYTGIFRIVDEA